MEALLVIAIIISLAFAAAVVTGTSSPTGAQNVLAAKGGHSGAGGGGKPSRSNATLVVSPASVSADGSTFTVSGSGYNAGELVSIGLANPGCCVSFNVLVDATGSIRFDRQAWLPGTYYVYAYRYGKGTLLASTSFVVQ